MAHEHLVTDSDAYFKIDPLTRRITNVSGKTVLIQHDHNSERFTFEVPKTVEGHDMSKCNSIQVHYSNIGRTREETQEGVYEVDDMEAVIGDTETVKFSWLVSSNATRYAGTLEFAIHFICSTEGEVEYFWSSDTFTGVSVNSTIQNSETVVNEYADILTKWKELLIDVNGTGLTQIEAAVKEALSKIGLSAEEIIAELNKRGDATVAESWAVGGTGTRPGEDTNNAWYWALEAAKKAIEAKEAAQSVGAINVVDNSNLVGQGAGVTLALQILLDAIGVNITNLRGKHTQRDVPLLASGWSDVYPYSQTVEVPGVEETSDIRIIGVKHAEGNTAEQDKAIDKAAGFLITNESGVGNGTLTFKAKKKPATDIVVIVEGG